MSPIRSSFFARDPREFEKNQRKTTDAADSDETKRRIFDPEVLQAPAKKLVPFAKLAQLGSFIFILYVMIAGLIFGVNRIFLAQHFPKLVDSIFFGMIFGEFMGLTWTLGTVVSANSSPAVKMLSTLALSPIRFILVLLGILMFAQSHPKSEQISTLVIFLVLFQVFNHGMQIYLSYQLDRNRTIDNTTVTASDQAAVAEEADLENNSTGEAPVQE